MNLKACKHLYWVTCYAVKHKESQQEHLEHIHAISITGLKQNICDKVIAIRFQVISKSEVSQRPKANKQRDHCKHSFYVDWLILLWVVMAGSDVDQYTTTFIS